LGKLRIIKLGFSPDKQVTETAGEFKGGVEISCNPLTDLHANPLKGERLESFEVDLRNEKDTFVALKKLEVIPGEDFAKVKSISIPNLFTNCRLKIERCRFKLGARKVAGGGRLRCYGDYACFS